MMMKLLTVFCVFAISELYASLDIKISQAQVAIQNGTSTFSPSETVFDCTSSQRHLYCSWKSPQLTKCDEKVCPLNGVKIVSDQLYCNLTIQHQGSNVNAGTWTCQLYYFTEENAIANATTELFIVNVNEVPLIRQTTPAIEFIEAPHVTKEAQFECVSSTKAPLEKYQWYFKNDLVSSDQRLRLNLTRQDFNKSLRCIIQKKINATHQIGDSIAKKDLIMNMNPIVIEKRRVDKGTYEILVESWPMPNFVRVSLVEECDNQCVIYKLVKNKYVMDTSPYLQPEDNFVQDIVIKGQVYGAKVWISLVFNVERLKDFKAIFISIGNNLNVANEKIDLLQHQRPHGYQFSSDSRLDQSSFIVTIVIVGVTVVSLVIGIILLILFRRQISESFKCGVYLVPHDDEDVVDVDDQDVQDKKNGKMAIPPETEF